MSDEAFLAVINPAAGGGRCGKRFPAALERLREAGVQVTRIAHGVPLGGELGYVDGSTLAHALSGRQPVPSSQ